MQGSLPVLLIVFNRPDLTRKVISQIRHARPERIYVASDGPRELYPEDPHLVAEVRKCLEDIDWPCQVLTKFSQTNLGLRSSVVAAIDWFFGREERGIILEDDCAPRPGFFDYMATMLAKFADEPRVWGVAGLNLLGDKYFGGHAWGLIGTPLIWGWGTWAARWEHYDRDLNSFTPELRKGPYAVWRDRYEFFAFDWHLRRLRDSSEPSTWDYQLSWTVTRNRGLWVVPRENYIDNLGVRADGTHTKSGNFRVNPTEIDKRASNLSAPPLERNKALQHAVHRAQHGVWVPLWTNHIRNLLRYLRIGFMSLFAPRN